MIRNKGLLKKVNKLINEIEQDPLNVVSIRRQIDGFMNGILHRYMNKVKHSFYVPYQEHKTVDLPYAWTEVDRVEIKPFIMSADEVKDYLFEVKDIIIRDILRGEI